MRHVKMVVVATFMIVFLVCAEIYLIKGATESKPQILVAFAKTAIPEESSVTEAMFELTSVDISMVHPLAVRELKAVNGKVASMNIEKGEMLLLTKLADEQEPAMTVVNPGNRLFSVAFSGDQANCWQISKGQLVDIIYVPETQAIESGQMVRVFRGIRVAAIMTENGQTFDATDTKLSPRYVSFEVTEDQAIFLASAKTTGRIELSVIPLLRQAKAELINN